MKVTDAQLNEFTRQYRSIFNIELAPNEAMIELQKIINLVLIISLPEKSIQELENNMGLEYSENAINK